MALSAVMACQGRLSATCKKRGATLLVFSRHVKPGTDMTLPYRSLHATRAPFCDYEVGSGQPPQGKLIRGRTELLPSEREKGIGGGGGAGRESRNVHKYPSS